MNRRELLSSELKVIGYSFVKYDSYVKSDVYKADFSNDEVEHYLYITYYNIDKHDIGAHFGLRNENAQNFAYLSGLKCKIIPNINKNYNKNLHSFMHFSFGRLFSPFHPLNLPRFSSFNESKEVLSWNLKQFLLPVILKIDKTRKLLESLVNDKEPIPWLCTNYALRAAYIVSLSRQIGLERSAIQSFLLPQSRGIELETKMSAYKYADQLIEDWNVEH